MDPEPLTDFSYAANQSRISAIDLTLNSDKISPGASVELVYRRALCVCNLGFEGFLGGSREQSELEFCRLWVPRWTATATGGGWVWNLPGAAVDY
jgi:hypothetical protein